MSSVGRVARTKMRFFQTIGVDEPGPGSSVFHFTFFFSDHSVGGVA